MDNQVSPTPAHVARHCRRREGLPTWSRNAAPAVDCTGALSLFGGLNRTTTPQTSPRQAHSMIRHRELREKEGGHLDLRTVNHPYLAISTERRNRESNEAECHQQ
ncbi:hypothetical protein MUK42_34792 [Musa troglodytarum]|uniref:Uncharacterized protein n=1 Tax=Musa troglodytarum TaxID=320322 RepID=A0A9E7GDF2_9LILI|nr:hypothetical protein MUK42_34792 [Musa troglodytarum]